MDISDLIPEKIWYTIYHLLSRWTKSHACVLDSLTTISTPGRISKCTDQLTVNTVLYEEEPEPVSSVCYMFRVLKLQLNLLETFAVCKSFVNSLQHLTFFTMLVHFWFWLILFFFFFSTCSWKPLNCKKLNSIKVNILLTCPANIPQTPTMQRMLKTAEPTMVPTPTSPWVINTPAEGAKHVLLPLSFHFTSRAIT